MKAFVLAAALVLTGIASADVIPPPPPAAARLTLNDLVFAQYGGGWVSVTENPNGASMSASLILKSDLTYENGASGKGPGPNGAVLSAIGQGYWFARLAADGTVEIALTRDQTDRDPAWVVRPAGDGTLIDGDKVWTRGK